MGFYVDLMDRPSPLSKKSYICLGLYRALYYRKCLTKPQRVKALRFNSRLEKLLIRHDDVIEDEVIQNISAALTHHPTLSQLCLIPLNTSNSCVTSCTKLLEQNTTITMLGIGGLFDSSSIEVLSKALQVNCTLTNLMIRAEEMSEREAEMLVSTIISNPRLVGVMIDINDMSDVIIRAITRSINSSSVIQNLSVASGIISDETMAEFSAMLRGNTHIRELTLYNNHISDAGITSLADTLLHNTTLAGLELYKLTDESLRILVATISQNSTLRQLEIDVNINALNQQPIAELMRNNPYLSEVLFGGGPVSDLNEITEALQQNFSITSLMAYITAEKTFELEWTPFLSRNAKIAPIIIQLEEYLRDAQQFQQDFPAANMPHICVGKLRLLFETVPGDWFVRRFGDDAATIIDSTKHILPGLWKNPAPLMNGNNGLVSEVWARVFGFVAIDNAASTETPADALGIDSLFEQGIAEA